jgi:hypothetical protein
MIKSQNSRPKLFLLFVIAFVYISLPGICESPAEKLQLADSLFKQKKYTQSFDLYRQIQLEDQKASGAMLLKMAFIKEGLGDYTNALYFLNLYYLKTYNKRVLKKMENLAEQNKLSGYNYDDAEFFLNLYHQYQLQIDLFFLSLILLFFAYLMFQRRQNKAVPLVQHLVFIALLIAVFSLNNFARERTKAIVVNSNIYLMKGPSPGSDVVDVVSKGHRVEILDRDDVWVKVSWNDEDAYIKAFNLVPVKL